MRALSLLFAEHGLAAVFICVLLEQLGAPVPALPLLLLAGARAAAEEAFAWRALGLATAACMIADTSWYFAGRRYGRPVLSLLCRASLTPDSCIEKTELSFARRAFLTVLVSKFIPGVSTLAPPLAGAMRMSLGAFLLIDLAGALLWIGSALTLGWLLRDQLEQVTGLLMDLGTKALLGLVVLLAVYIAWKVLRRRGDRGANKV
jgi:membrane protein DedA with SNARE-associated domain